MKGAFEMVFKHCSLLYSSSSSRLLTDRDRGHFESVAAEMGRHGLRGTFLNLSFLFLFQLPRLPLSFPILFPVVAVAVGDDLSNMKFVGLMGMWDPPRVGVATSVHQLLDGGVAVKMITGDAQETAESIGENKQTDSHTGYLCSCQLTVLVYRQLGRLVCLGRS